MDGWKALEGIVAMGVLPPKEVFCSTVNEEEIPFVILGSLQNRVTLFAVILVMEISPAAHCGALRRNEEMG